MKKTKSSPVLEQKSGFTDTGMLSMSSTERFDQKLLNHLQYPAPGLRSCMIDHGVERLPIVHDVASDKSVSRKPAKYLDFNGDPGGVHRRGCCAVPRRVLATLWLDDIFTLDLSSRLYDTAVHASHVGGFLPHFVVFFSYSRRLLHAAAGSHHHATDGIRPRG